MLPGRTRVIFGGGVGGREFYWHAHDQLENEWAGGQLFNVPREAFDMCTIAACPPPRCRPLGFRYLAFGSVPIFRPDHTINLVLASSQRKSNSSNIRDVLPTKRKLKYRKYRRGIIKLERRSVSQCTKCKACSNKRKH